MLVNTNLSSLTAQRMLFENTKAASTAMERLATGSKINKAQDDVAGSAIADRMTSQVRGLNMAVKNANDALSMLSVAEAAAADQTDILQRIRKITLQATNDTNSQQDRAYLQSEAMELVGEVNRIGSKTEFNGEAINGLKNFQVGANAGQSMSVFIGLSSAYSGSVFAQSAQDYDIGDDFIEVNGLSKVGPFEFGDMVLISEKSYFVQGVGNTQTNDDGTFSQTISLNNGEGTSGLLTPVTQEFELISAFGTIGDNNVYTSGGRNSLFRIDLATNPSEAVAAIDEAMRVLVSMRASIGAAQNRINYTVSNLMSVSEQTTAARSRIEDADFAAESAVLAKTQVLQLTATAMLAQANAKPQLVLELIR